MKFNNFAFKNSLLCLQQPLSLLSMVILLLNDHVLKIYCPSWVTGKLSDFAGLFFFPFLLTAVLGLVLKRTKISPSQEGYAAFGIVALIFILLKTIPSANLLASQIVSRVLGSHIKFALDRTDLIGLVSLWPAWRLWKKTKSIEPRRLAYVALSIGMLASIATSPMEITIWNVSDLSYAENGTIFAADKTDHGEENFTVAVSQDGGYTWELSWEDSDRSLVDKKTYPIEDCRYEEVYNVTNCYRVTSLHTFLTGYKYPRDKSFSWEPVFPKNGLTVKAYDLIIIPYDGKQVILVAVGEAGILRRELPNGNWELIRVLHAGENDGFKYLP